MGRLRATKSDSVETNHDVKVEKVLDKVRLRKELSSILQKVPSSRSLRFAKLRQVAPSTGTTRPTGSKGLQPQDLPQH